MGYYMTGDYYSRGGIGSFLRKAAGAAVGFVTGGPVGAAASLLGSRPSSSGFAATSQLRIPQININPSAALPGGNPLFTLGGKRRRRMNYGNTKALTRASRRVDGFVGVARKALKHTGYKVVSKHAGKPGKKGGNVFVETGPGGIRG